jgi:hypothetical protein
MTMMSEKNGGEYEVSMRKRAVFSSGVVFIFLLLLWQGPAFADDIMKAKGIEQGEFGEIKDLVA